jgi:23S rRNA (pseudouridine1915-N3)-methyltransferase
MKVICFTIGPTESGWMKEGLEVYIKRLKRYLSLEWYDLPDVKTKSKEAHLVLEAEADLLLSRFIDGDYVILLDEAGEMLSSRGLAERIERLFHLSHKRIVFVVGGAFGFSDRIYARANARLSLSKMTFSHQMIRVFFSEQLYRAMTILKNEPYHND